MTHLTDSQPDALDTQSSIIFDSENHYLIIDVPPTNSHLRLGTWERGLSVERLNPETSEWEEDSDPCIPFFLETSDYNDSSPFSLFSHTIPANIISAISRFQWTQLTLVRIFKKNPGLLQLLAGNPVLVWLLADRVVNGFISLREASGYKYNNAKDILEIVTGIRSGSLVRLLSKIRFTTYTQDGLFGIEKLIANKKVCKNLKHIKHIQGDFLRYYLKNHPIVRARFFIDELVAMNKGQGNVTIADLKKTIFLWENSLRIGRSLGIKVPAKLLLRIKTVHDLQLLHDQWFARYHEITKANTASFLVKK